MYMPNLESVCLVKVTQDRNYSRNSAKTNYLVHCWGTRKDERKKRIGNCIKIEGK